MYFLRPVVHAAYTSSTPCLLFCSRAPAGYISSIFLRSLINFAHLSPEFSDIFTPGLFLLLYHNFQNFFISTFTNLASWLYNISPSLPCRYILIIHSKRSKRKVNLSFVRNYPWSPSSIHLFRNARFEVMISVNTFLIKMTAKSWSN